MAAAATSAATTRTTRVPSSASPNKTVKIEKLQSLVTTGIFRPKTEYSRTSVLIENAKSARTAKFRTDILIEELEKLIKDLQEFLKIRLSSNKYDATQGPDSILELKKKLDFNIIKYEIVKKLNVELNYARNALDEAIRHQGDIGSARKRTVWLEEKIESIILAQNEISFPMHAQLMNDATLRVKRIGKSEESNKDGSDHREQHNKSTVSTTDSLLKELHNENVEDDFLESFVKFRRRSSMLSVTLDQQQDSHKDLRSADESNEYYSVSVKSETIKQRQKNVSICENDPEKREYETEEDQVESDERIAQQIELNMLNQTEKKKPTDDIDLPHRRFEWTPNVKTLYSMDPTTFHQLGLSVRDSYIQRDDEISSDLPWLKNKKELESEDHETKNTARRIETLYKKICKATIESILPQKTDNFTPVLVPSSKEPISTRAKRLIKSFKRPGEAENTLPKKDDKRLGSTQSHSFVFFPHPITPSTPLPCTRANSNKAFPRSSKEYGTFDSHSFTAPRRLVNQRNLKDESKLNLYRPKVANTNSITSDPTIVFYDPKRSYDKTPNSGRNENNLLNTILEASSWNQIKPISSPVKHDGLKFERVRTLLSKNIVNTSSLDERIDAARHLGLLRAGDSAVIYTLQTILDNKSEPETLRLECAKSLVLLGCWREDVFNYMIKYLKYGQVDIQLDFLKTVIEGKNVEYIDPDTPGFDHFKRVLEELTYHRDESVSLDASVCLGKLGVIDSMGAQYILKHVIENNSDWVKKTLALEVYVRQFNKPNRETLDYVLKQLQKAPTWPSRAAASRLLGVLGQSLCCTRENIESVYNTLEQRLCEDPIKEVRIIIGETMKELQLYNRVIVRMTKNLENQNEDVRAKAVVALDTLGVRRTKVIQILVDMLELDGSDHVRVLVIKTLLNLAPNDIRVKIAFDKLERNSHLNTVLKKFKNEVKNLTVISKFIHATQRKNIHEKEAIKENS